MKTHIVSGGHIIELHTHSQGKEINCGGKLKYWQEEDDNWRYFKSKCLKCGKEWEQKTNKIYFKDCMVNEVGERLEIRKHLERQYDEAVALIRQMEIGNAD